MKKELDTSIGLADSELIGYEKTAEKELIVTIERWNTKRIIFTFSDVIGVRDSCAGDFSAVVEETDTTPFFSQIIEFAFEKIPADHGYHLYQFINLDDETSLEIVAADLAIT